MSNPANKSSSFDIDGMFVCYKPSGLVSKDVSRLITKHFGKVKLGHVGTLDPLAEGVLPILLGKATRLQDYLLDGKKTYEFDIRFGVSTDTCDSEGQAVETREFKHVEIQNLENVCSQLVGEFEQVPPIYSAIKFKGKPLYQYAREGRQAEVCLDDFRKSVQIHSLRVLQFDLPRVRLEMVCGKGTYVRSVAVKISEMLGTCGMVSRLLRSFGSGISVDQAHSLAEVANSWDRFEDFVIPMSDIKLNLPVWQVKDSETVKRLLCGQRLLIDQKCFRQSLEFQEDYSDNEVDKFLLRNETGDAFGIGSSLLGSDGQVTAFLHRGL